MKEGKCGAGLAVFCNMLLVGGLAGSRHQHRVHSQETRWGEGRAVQNSGGDVLTRRGGE